MDAEAVESLLKASAAHVRAGEISAALQTAAQALELAASGGSLRWQAAALVAQGEAYFRLGQYSSAVALSHQALAAVAADQELAAASGLAARSALLAESHLLLGRCAAETDDMPGGEASLRQAIEFSRLAGDDRLLVRGLHSLSAGVYMPRAQFGLSLAADEEALAIIKNRQMPELAWAPLTTMTWVCWLSNQLERCAALLADLRQAALPGSLGEGWAHCIAAFLALQAGRMEEARAAFGRTRSIGEALGSPELNFMARLGLARLERQNGDLANAMCWAADAAVIAERVGYRHLQGMAEVECGRCSRDNGESKDAEQHFQSAVALLSPLQANLELAQARLALAALRLELNEPAKREIQSALAHIHANGLHFLLDQERTLAYPLVTAGLSSRDPALTVLSSRLVEALQRVPPPPLKIQTLGGLQVWQGGRRVEAKGLAQRRSGELLILLLSSPGLRLTLEEAAERLWPERPAAQDLLHQATSALRRVLEPDLPSRFPSRYLRVEDGSAQLLAPWNSGLTAWVDFAAFTYTCQIADWEAALQIYQGDFLPELPFTDWCVPLRQHYSLLHQNALLQAARQRLENGAASAALQACRALLAVEPWQEQAVLVGMRAAVALGDIAAARRLYINLETALRQELGVAPQAELQDLFRQL